MLAADPCGRIDAYNVRIQIFITGGSKAMKRQAMMASLMALALLVSPLGSVGGMNRVSAEEQQGAELYSVSGNTQEKVQIDTPTNLRWRGVETWAPSSEYDMLWDGVNPSKVLYPGGGETARWRCEISRVDGTDDGEVIRRGTIGDDTSSSHSYALFYMDAGGDAMISGNYRFRVKALAADGDEQYRDSEWSEWSDSMEYVHPGQELDNPQPYWDEEKVGLCHVGPSAKYDPEYLSKYASRYVLTLYKVKGNDREGYYCTSAYAYIYPDKAVCDVDFSDAISQNGSGQYYVTAQCTSNDIDVIASGKVSPRSEILDTTVNADKLSSILSGATDKSAAETVEQLTGSAESSSIQQAMQTSDTFREQIKELEERYATEQNITVQLPVVSDTAGKYIDVGRVSVVGAAFNAAQGREVCLHIDETANKVSYKAKNVQLDIKLVSGDEELHDLTMPISVTMPIPEGINADRLIIMHYPEDSTPRKVAFHDNADGTVTFTVADFSTFVFAENTPGSIPNPVPGQSANSGSSIQTDLEGQIAAAASGATVKVTREQNINALSNSVMQMLVKRGDVTLEMEYTYEGTDYYVIIPAGMAVDDATPWYGPLYLSAYYSAGNAQAPATGAAAYIVQKGDTLGRIARANGMTLGELATKNPQIKNLNRIVPGQIINIK